MSDDLIRKFKIVGVVTEKQFEAMSFGNQIAVLRQFEAFKLTAKTNHVSQKRVPWKKALNEFIKLYEVKEYYCTFHAGPNCWDDSYQIWYKN